MGIFVTSQVFETSQETLQNTNKKKLATFKIALQRILENCFGYKRFMVYDHRNK